MQGGLSKSFKFIFSYSLFKVVLVSFLMIVLTVALWFLLKLTEDDFKKFQLYGEIKGYSFNRGFLLLFIYYLFFTLYYILSGLIDTVPTLFGFEENLQWKIVNVFKNLMFMGGTTVITTTFASTLTSFIPSPTPIEKSNLQLKDFVTVPPTKIGSYLYELELTENTVLADVIGRSNYDPLQRFGFHVVFVVIWIIILTHKFMVNRILRDQYHASLLISLLCQINFLFITRLELTVILDSIMFHALVVAAVFHGFNQLITHGYVTAIRIRPFRGAYVIHQLDFPRLLIWSFLLFLIVVLFYNIVHCITLLTFDLRVFWFFLKAYVFPFLTRLHYPLGIFSIFFLIQ